MTPEANKNNVMLKSMSPEKVESAIRSFRTLLILGGGASLLASGLQFPNLLNHGFSVQGLFNVLSNFIVGLVCFLCTYLLKKRSATLVYVYGVLVAYGIIISTFFGSWLNVIAIIVGLAFLITFYVLKKQGELR